MVKLARDVVEVRYIRVTPGTFECPHCGHYVSRGGHAEGFRKSGMNNHVAMCYERLLLRAGFVQGSHRQVGKRYGHTAEPFDAAVPYHQKVRRAVMAQERRFGFTRSGDLKP